MAISDKQKEAFQIISAMMQLFCSVIPVTYLNKPNAGNGDSLDGDIIAEINHS
jgi:hypothetical protein